MKRLISLLLCLLLAACSMNSEKVNLTLSEAVLEQRGKTSKDYEELNFELLHAHFYSAELENGLTVVLAADACTNSLGDNSQIHRLEGKLNQLLDGMDQTMSLEDFSSALPEAVAGVEIGAGTAYYVSDQYAIVLFDSDGNGTQDICLNIALNQEETIEPDAVAWLSFETESK